jgi:site-specific DNA recombinase
MFVWYAEEGRSLYRLAQKLHQDGVTPPRVQGRWNVQTLRGILTNPVYTGEVYAGRLQEACGTGATATPRRVRPREDWITVASIPAIVTQEQFERVQDKLAQNRQFARRNNTAHAYLLRALVSCGVCGLACQGRCLPSGYRYYCCRGKLYRPRLVRHRIACYAARAASESWFCRTAAGVWNPCRSMSQVVL